MSLQISNMNEIGQVTPASNKDVAGLIEELKRNLAGEVRFDAGSRGLYSRDASNYRQIPIGVVIPRSRADVLATLAACRKFGVPILARGGGTSLAGQCCNVAVVLDFSKYMNGLLELNDEQHFARVQPGLVLDHLRRQAELFHLTFGPDPATHNHCTLGGMIGNNSCGVHSVMAGRTADNIEELDVVLYDGTELKVGPTSEQELHDIIAQGGRRGEIYRRLKELRDRYGDLIRERYPNIPRRVSGYNLDELLPEKGFHVARALVGSECTCALVLEAKTRLIHWPPHRALTVIGYPDVYSAGEHIPEIMEHQPIGLEGIDHHLVRYMKVKGMHPDDLALVPPGRGWLLVEFGGESHEEAAEKARQLKAALSRKNDSLHIVIYESQDEQEKIWKIRESGLGATAFVPGEHDTWPGWEDAAVPPEKVGDYLRDFRGLLEKFGYGCSLYGHFGQGCVHTRIDFELKTQDGLANYRRFANEAAELVVSYGGSLSGEHGDGQSRAELLPIMYGDELIEAFREFKSIWDPDWKMNPGKIVDPNPLDSHLALGPDYHPLRVKTHFQYPEDHGDFAHAAIRCVGVGKCRRTEGGVMCPSYMVTHEEKHTTRGRARLLYEMLQGDVIKDGFASEEVKEALDLCLACKGCKGDCPVNVDMATYKAEFLSHYYQHHLRPRSAFAMGLIPQWARMAAWAPRLVNWLTHTEPFSSAFKWLGGVAPERDTPRFSETTFQDWFAEHEANNVGQLEVLLWPDTFTNYFHPEIGRAAVRILEDAGWNVQVPQARLCCGRPLYDYGMLDQAREMLVRILDELRPAIRQGVPLVGLEPSCVAVFRDELVNMFSHDEDAQRLSQQTYCLSEFLLHQCPDYQLPQLKRHALVHAHCHHHAIMKFRAEKELLEKMGLEYEVADSGCCGMAGSFGFEKQHYDISIACGERVLLPAVREAEDDTLIIANGFSCQEQIRQQTGRRALHLAEVLEMALDYGESGPPNLPPEDARQTLPAHSRHREMTPMISAAVFAVGVLAGWSMAGWVAGRKSDRAIQNK